MEDEGNAAEERFEEVRIHNQIDENLGFSLFDQGDSRDGWLVNMHPTIIKTADWPSGCAGVDYYFIEEDGGTFKSTVLFQPYFSVECKVSQPHRSIEIVRPNILDPQNGMETIVEEWLMRKYEGLLVRITREKKEDLKMPNHLLGHRRTFLQLFFQNQQDMLTVRREIVPIALANRSKLDAIDAYAEVISATNGGAMMDVELEGAYGGSGFGEGFGDRGRKEDPSELITDVREYDIPYVLRVAIDNNVRVGLWYTVSASDGHISFKALPDRVKRGEPVVMAYDIETSKAPLKFPDSNHDPIMMISYMVDGQGFLITNREIVSEDIEDFEYTPKAEYEGPFTIFNERNEEEVIRRFFEHIVAAKPTVMATYNGDAFDFPYVEARANSYGISMYNEIGFAKDSEDEFKCRSIIHMDCFRWVKRDSYLPQGSQGLKAVTVAKLGYSPLELDPELMTPYAVEQPQTLAQYSVSDAVATYYLYMKYVHPFVFSLCNIIPLNPDEVLRKGTGTLCETLLMVEAFNGNIIMPNRHEDPHGTMHEGHLLESETYVGGHVEALQAGVFRSDIATDFKIVPSAVQQLIDELDPALKFAIEVEGEQKMENVTNYDEVKTGIQTALEEMRDKPVRLDTPLIYHLDVAAMYPNIMLSNRLQPDSVKDESECATCDFNRPGKVCDRRMTWAWRGEYFPAKRDEFNMIKHALEQEWFPGKYPNQPKRRFVDLSATDQTALLHKRLGDYSRKVYKKTHETKIINREAIICQRENPFYIDTVRAFRDRRYTYKGLHKTWKKNHDKAKETGTLEEVVEAGKMIVIYDSLQLAHKVILNSFYGYVMRKGARWYSMEMAGITCLTGASIIQMARQLVEQIGRPLELDTDGIWCMLPKVFPENFSFKLADGKKLFISYPCTMLNHLVYDKFTNHQYHDLVDKEVGTYAVHSENSIFFELDGPYKAMILPSSKEEDKLLKKRYAVFNDDGSLAELKGFEVKRRGELQLIKIFQSQIFDKFLLGTTTEDCYAEVAKVADQWLDVLFSKASNLEDDELVELIAENRSMSKTLAEYGTQKSTSIRTAKRLGEFLGDQMVKDKGLACRFIISAKPHGAPVTERAVPVAIFSAEPSVKRHYLRKWLKDNSLTEFDLRSILDWGYYIERLGSVIQKLITIPAALQHVRNPVPRIRHPDWLFKRVARSDDKFKQHTLTDMFTKMRKNAPPPAEIEAEAGPSSSRLDNAEDIEDFGKTEGQTALAQRRVAVVTSKRKEDSKGKGKAQPEPEEQIPLPDMNVDYPGWLEAMKPRWKKRREEAQRVGHVPAAKGSLVSMVERRSIGMASQNWDVIQVHPSSRPGEFRLWLAIDGSLQQLKLRIPRQFYLNLKTVPEPGTFADGYLVESLSRTLPRGQPCLNLFRITVAEDVFLEQETHFSDMINNPNVDGVYEMQIPLLTRSLLKLGTACVLGSAGQGGLSKGLDKGFDLQDLERAGHSLTRRKYLEDKRLQYIYLFHAMTEKRHIFGLFLPTGEVKVYVLDADAGNNRARLDALREGTPTRALEKLYSDRLAKQKSQPEERDEAFPYPDMIEITTNVYGSEAVALKAIGKDLAVFRTQRAPTMLVVYSPKSQQWFDQGTGASSQFPLLMVPANKADNSFPPVAWQTHASRRMLGHYMRASGYVKERIGLAAYYEVPVCNIEPDAPLFLADIEFARRLVKADMVLWWSPSPRPDLGGSEEDANAQQSVDDLASPEFNVPGCYSSVCLEVEIKDLAIDAVLQSAIVNEMEGSGAGSMAFDSASHTLDEYARGTAHAAVTLGDAVLSMQTFGVLKAMVKACYLDRARGQSKYADIAIDHFWRWISSSAANMFDPGVYRFVHGLMRKTFLQLLAEFKRLGANVVYANFSRIFLLTSKPSAGSAFAYCNYLLSAVNSRELLKHVSLETIYFWEYLLFMDINNFGGVINYEPAAIEPVTAFEVDMRWNIRSFLPAALQDPFQQIVAEFIYEMYDCKQKLGDAFRAPLRIIQNATQGSEDPAKAKELEFGRRLIGQHLSRKLFKQLEVIQKRQLNAAVDPEERALFTFPQLPGSHLKLTNPSLEFVKFVCATLGLSKELANEVQSLKKNLLDMVRVREFADEAVFRNPCVSIKLPTVICTRCNTESPFDLCRDPDLMPDATEDGSQTTIKAWLCKRCDHEHDRRAIEASLVDIVRRYVSSYQLQDLRCSKCKQLRDDSLSMHDVCGGAYALSLSKAEIRKRLTTLAKLSAFHSLPALGAVVNFQLAHM
uniref:DNA polymerase epsilon catalytic subunit n=1 Tax=Bartheletia paradoxa TaxID=669517 RepID=A0A2D0XI06_9BASI|nr:hypothetical protein SPAR03885 [Bartheletia paradoxa]